MANLLIVLNRPIETNSLMTEIVLTLRSPDITFSLCCHKTKVGAITRKHASLTGI